METISRRQFLSFLCTSLALTAPYSLALSTNNLEKENRLPITIGVLKAAYVSEMAAHKHYDGYCRKAVEENYPNLAYLFRAFSVSERIHADNFKNILISFSIRVEEPMFDIQIADTKRNLRNAAKKELIKIKKKQPLTLL